MEKRNIFNQETQVALLIGCLDYSKGPNKYDDIPTAGDDILRIRDWLRPYNFEITVLINPTYEKIQ